MLIKLIYKIQCLIRNLNIPDVVPSDSSPEREQRSIEERVSY